MSSRLSDLLSYRLSLVVVCIHVHVVSYELSEPLYCILLFDTRVGLSLDSDSSKWKCRSGIRPQVDEHHVFFYMFFLRHFRLLVGRQVDGPLWAVCVPLSGPLCVVLGRSQGLCGWVDLGRSQGICDSSDQAGKWLKPMRASDPASGSWAPCWRSWAALGASVGGPGALLEPLLAVLGRLGPKSGPNPSGRGGRESQAGTGGQRSDRSDRWDRWQRSGPSTKICYRRFGIFML